jgi:hypothetical protein
MRAAGPGGGLELFELEMLGGPMERRFRKARPEVEQMPWGTLELTDVPEPVLAAARMSWTTAAFQEHRTAAACSATLRALVEARAPLDLIAGFARFPMDELVHVELCARMAMELGGGAELWHEPWALSADADQALPPLLRACELVVRNFCVGEALSIPLLHGAWLRAGHPLPRAILGRIVRDEAAHGVFGWTFLDWALPLLPAEGEDLIRRTAAAAIQEIRKLWDSIRRRPPTPAGEAHALGWMASEEYLALAARSLGTRVLRPFAERGFDLGGGPGPDEALVPDRSARS